MQEMDREQMEVVGQSAQEMDGEPMKFMVQYSGLQIMREIISLWRERMVLVRALSRSRWSARGRSSRGRFVWRPKKQHLANQDTRRMNWQVSSISEQTVSVQKGIDSSKIKPAFIVESIPEQVYLPYGARDHEEAFDFILHEAQVLCYQMQSVALMLRENSIPISLKKINSVASRLMELSVHISLTQSSKSGGKTWSEMVGEERISFADYRICWESTWGSNTELCGGFEDTTTFSPMHFTQCTPGIPQLASVTGSTLQIYTIKIAEPNGKLDWPLYVYGVVAARDTVDNNRNLLFCRSRANCQMLTEEDSFLRLTGPSRAILAVDPVIFEVELRIKDGAGDRALITEHYRYYGRRHTVHIGRRSCTAELSLELLDNSVQATILGVRVVDVASWPFEHGGRVACYSRSAEVMAIDSQGIAKVTDPRSRQVILLDYKGKEIPVGSNGYLHLSRHVVSVNILDTLKVTVQAYSPSGCIAAHVYFTPKRCNISQDICVLGDSKVEVTVAWSRLVQNKMDVSTEAIIAQT